MLLNNTCTCSNIVFFQDSSIGGEDCSRNEGEDKGRSQATPKNRKRTKGQSRIEKSLSIVMDKFVAAQECAEKKYLELEEKRMKLMMEAEEHRLELEERRREAERQHEMNMWMMMMQTLGSGMPLCGPPWYQYPYHPQTPGHTHETQESQDYPTL